MSRHRSPRNRPAPYITSQGHRRLVDELKRLWKVERPAVTAKVAEAAALGDRSENAEYIYGKKQLREIDARIRHLSKRLDELVVVVRVPAEPDRVYFGAWIEVADERGTVSRYRIVGPDEFDRASEYISIDAPVARALLGKRVGDTVAVAGPGGQRRLQIKSVRYEDAP